VTLIQLGMAGETQGGNPVVMGLEAPPLAIPALV
jgi:hypothetical protein